MSSADLRPANHHSHSRVSLSTTNALRLISVILVGLSFVVMHSFGVGQVGDSMQWKNGNTSISAGSHPAVLVWAAATITLFILLMLRKPSTLVVGIPSFKRRVLAFLIDFWLSLIVVSSVGALIPLSLEAMRTGHFAWQFQRNYSANTDELAALASLIFMALMVAYFAFPLTRGRQTVGYFIVGLKVTPPFGDEGRFTFKAAVVRTFYASWGGCSVFTRSWDRDEEGRTWWDRQTNCTVALVNDD
jgi:RDD family